MPIIINGVDVADVRFNDVVLDRVYFDNVLVWERVMKIYTSVASPSGAALNLHNYVQSINPGFDGDIIVYVDGDLNAGTAPWALDVGSSNYSSVNIVKAGGKITGYGGDGGDGGGITNTYVHWHSHNVPIVGPGEDGLRNPNRPNDRGGHGGGHGGGGINGRNIATVTDGDLSWIRGGGGGGGGGAEIGGITLAGGGGGGMGRMPGKGGKGSRSYGDSGSDATETRWGNGGIGATIASSDPVRINKVNVDNGSASGLGGVWTRRGENSWAIGNGGSGGELNQGGGGGGGATHKQWTNWNSPEHGRGETGKYAPSIYQAGSGGRTGGNGGNNAPNWIYSNQDNRRARVAIGGGGGNSGIPCANMKR